jgi:flagellar hook-basal body complex protein FliE
LGEDQLFAQAPAAPGTGFAAASDWQTKPSANLFDDMLAGAIKSLDGVSRSEFYANDMVEKYVRGEADLQTVMLAQSKASIQIQLAVTSINAAVTTFKELTQLQI